MTADARLHMTFAGGEDYELLLAMSPEDVDTACLACESVGVPLAVIGQVTDGDGVRIVGPEGKDFGAHGWDHFAG